MSRRISFAFFVIAAMAFSPARGDDDMPADATKPIRVTRTNFLLDIQPIFDKHCVACHGPQEQSSGLRLDSAMLARKGGVTQRPIIGGTLSTNEIFQRVSSTDAAYRMPKGHDPLTEQEIAAIREWVDEGCPVQERIALAASSKTAGGASTSRGEFWFDWADRITRWVQKTPYSMPFLYVGLVLLLLLLIWPRIPRLPALRGDRQVLILVLYFGSFLYLQQQGTANLERERADRLQSELSKFLPNNSKNPTQSFFDRFGRPPIPKRLRHPRALARVYYRGNCERNDKLFNSGNYCTNTFELALRSAGGVPLNDLDPVPPDGVSIHFEIVRSYGSTPLLYQDDQMTKVFVTSGAFGETDGPRTESSLKIVESGNRWAVDLPVLDCPTASGQIVRRFYVSMGAPVNDENVNLTHYAFELSLIIDDGKISPESDLWMGCLMSPPQVIPAEDSRLPFCEWFDWRPLPIIEGENTTDLKTLGVLDHRPELATPNAPPATEPSSEPDAAPKSPPP